jgi:hypothetical protein
MAVGAKLFADGDRSCYYLNLCAYPTTKFTY